MLWRVEYSSRSLKQIKKNRFSFEDVQSVIAESIRKLSGEETNTDIKKLQGPWSGFHRIRMGEARIIARFDFEGQVVRVARIDWHGRVYN